jgi:hypothetical protein
MKNQKGISLVEVVVVLATIGFLVLIIANVPSSLVSINKSRQTALAEEIASRKIESLRNTGFVDLAQGVSEFSDPDLFSLPSAQAEFEVTECPLEICSMGEDAKILQVRVFWGDFGNEHKVSLETLISEGGIAQ